MNGYLAPLPDTWKLKARLEVIDRCAGLTNGVPIAVECGGSGEAAAWDWPLAVTNILGLY